jgi:hypothetical protein
MDVARHFLARRGSCVVGSHGLGKFGFGFGFKLGFEMEDDALDWWTEWQLCGWDG